MRAIGAAVNLSIPRQHHLALLLALAAAPACTGDAPGTSGEDCLTSVTARERAMSFDGYVYVDADASDSTILQAVKRQNKSVFGALRTATISANNRELSEIDTASFVKEPVEVVDPQNPDAQPAAALRVRYRYTDRALVPVSMAERSAIHLALLHGYYQSQSERILEECTENSSHDREFESAIWYVFNPSLDQCTKAIEAEEAAIQQARRGPDGSRKADRQRRARPALHPRHHPARRPDHEQRQDLPRIRSPVARRRPRRKAGGEHRVGCHGRLGRGRGAQARRRRGIPDVLRADERHRRSAHRPEAGGQRRYRISARSRSTGARSAT